MNPGPSRLFAIAFLMSLGACARGNSGVIDLEEQDLEDSSDETDGSGGSGGTISDSSTGGNASGGATSAHSSSGSGTYSTSHSSSSASTGTGVNLTSSSGSSAVCGNSDCDGGETCSNCPIDCGECGGCHDVCSQGTAMSASCDSCVADLCQFDSLCCSQQWDDICVSEAEVFCETSCGLCAHSKCELSATPLSSTCDPCVAAVCLSDSFCCTTEWDSYCLAAVQTQCGLTCDSCAHDYCSQGAALSASCDPCVQSVCAADPFCCDPSFGLWDSYCIGDVLSVCGVSCY